MLTKLFCALAIGSRDLDWLEILKRHIEVDEII